MVMTDRLPPNQRHHRNVMPLESYIAYTPPTADVIGDAERGLNVEYDNQWADQVYSFLSSGKSLLSWCEQDGKPARSLVLQWLQNTDLKFEYLRERFDKAMTNRALAMIDEAADIADESLVVNAKGFFDPVSALDKKQRFDAKLRMAGLLDPLKFSPTTKTAQQIALTQINVTKNNVSELTDEQLLRVLTEFERKKDEHTVDVESTGGDGSTGASSPTQRPLLPG
jgi:hypothetical protein